MYFEGGSVMREASLDLTTSQQIRRASDSPPMASRAKSQQQNNYSTRTESKTRLLDTAKKKRKNKSLAKILFPPNTSASEMVRRGRLGKFVSPKKVSEICLSTETYSHLRPTRYHATYPSAFFSLVAVKRLI